MNDSLLLFVGMNLPPALSAGRLASRLFARRGLPLLLGTTLLIHLVLAIGITGVVGLFGMISPSAFIAVGLAVLVNVLLLFPASSTSPDQPEVFWNVLRQKISFSTTDERRALVLIAWGMVIAATALALGLITRPISYDSLTYHLFFPARWLQEGGLSVIPTPFGDPAPAYSPLNCELWYLWLLAPFGNDNLARVGQFPFLILALLSLYGIGRNLSLPRLAAVVVTVLFTLNPLVLNQSVCAEVDLALTACFLASVWLLLEYRRSRSSSFAIASGLAAGLFLGTKYIAAIYFPVLLGLALLVFLFRPQATKAELKNLSVWLVMVLLFGGVWYLRNLFWFGSPVYPAGIWVFGQTVFEGPTTRASMLQSIFHVPKASMLPVIAAYAWGVCWFVPCLILWLAGGVKTYLRNRQASDLLGWLAAIILILLWALAIPYNTQYRFLLPAVALTWLGAGPLFVKKGPARTVAGIIAVLAAFNSLLLNFSGLSLAGLPVQHTATLAQASIPWLAVAMVLVIVIFISSYRFGLLRAGTLTLVFVLLTGASALILPKLETKESGRYLRIGLAMPTDQALNAWNWVGNNLDGEVLAYAGTNAAYPLLGPRLTNRVIYADVSGRIDWRLHDHFADHLATKGRPPASDKPAFYREDADYHKWLAGLKRLGVTYLYVQTMGRDEQRRLRHDQRGFPLERQWAKENPARFKPVYSGDRAEIYRVVTDNSVH